MEEYIALKEVLNDYICEQSNIDTEILRLFVFDEIHNIYKISNITGYSIPRINYVIRRLRNYMRKQGYC